MEVFTRWLLTVPTFYLSTENWRQNKSEHIAQTAKYTFIKYSVVSGWVL